MLWTVAVILGGAGSALRSRRWTGLFPGLLLALVACWAFRGIPPVWPSRQSLVRRAGLLLAGTVSGLFAAPRPQPRFDLPLDLRIAAALLLGFLARGGVGLVLESIDSIRR
jgi:hypothetical protein